MSQRKFQNSAGFSTLEILIAMVILILAITAVILVSFGNQSVLADSQTSNEALNIAQGLLEQEQALARKDFNLVNPIALRPDPNDSIYQEEVDVVADPNNQKDYSTKKVTALVSWTTDHGRAQSTSLSILVTNFTNAVGGDTCSSVLTGDWTHPQVKNMTTDFATLVGDSTGTYTLTDADANSGKLYVVSNNPSLSSGPNNPGSAADDSSFGSAAWTNSNNVKANDNNYATAILSSGSTTHYIKATNFGFNIPNSATILGIKVEIERKGSSSTNTVRDSVVKLAKSDGSLAATSEAHNTSWSTSEAYDTYGSTSDLWGDTSWSPSTIDNANFGVVLAATTNSGSGSRTASVDHIRVTITYIKSFYILNVSNPSSPSLMSALANNPSMATGLNAVAVSGNYAYVATNAGPASGQMQVIDISVTPPMVKATYTVPGAIGSGTQAIGSSIAYNNGYVYLGLKTTASGPEFNVVDVHNPLAPTNAGGVYDTGGHDVNAIFVKGRYAYLATPSNPELRVLDVSNPTSISAAGTYDAPDSIGNGKSLALVGDTLYLGRTVTAASPELYALDNSDPENIVASPLGTREISSSVNSLIIRDYLAFLITTSGQFQVWKNDSSTSPWTITQHAIPPLTLPSTGAGVAMDCEGNYLYAVSVPSSGTNANKGSISIITGP